MSLMAISRAFAFIVALQAGVMATEAMAAGEIRVGYPVVLDDGARPERFDAAIAKALCDSIGKPCRAIELDGPTGMAELLDNRIDVLVSYFDSIAGKYKAAVTKDYARMPLAFVMRQDSGPDEISPAALTGKTVAVGDMEGKSFALTRLPKSFVRPQGNFLAALATGQADLAVAKLDLAFHEIDMASGESCCKIVGVLNDVASLTSGSRVVVRKSDKALKDLIDKTIGDMAENGKIKEAGLAIFGFDVSPEAISDNPHFPSAPETSRDIEPAIAARMVKLVMPRARCSGVLLSNRAVLTAAHCFANEKSTVNVKPRQIALYQSDKKLARKAVRIIVHPDYRALTSADIGSSDIALLILEDDGSTLPAPRFLTGREPFLAADMMDLLFIDAALYGYGNRDRKDSRMLKNRARLSLMAPRPDSFLGQSEKFFMRSAEFCQGDSGGGLFFAPGGVVSAEEAPLLLGILSTHGEAQALCDDAGEIIRTDFFADWIAATLKKHGID